MAYPGTMGTEYIDYLIADPTLYTRCPSKSTFLRRSFICLTAIKLTIASVASRTKLFTRAEVRLPEDAFVFCCFNNNFKITPEVFDCWMRILKRVDNSVIWLFEENTKATSNLRKEAEIRGVHPERLIFAKRMPLPDHLARHRLADLFLDTLPYNAHTTASDALWAGLPVLTRIGETFAGRVAASLLNAIGLTELITSTPQAYEALAIDLATNPEKLAAIKHKLAKIVSQLPCSILKRLHDISKQPTRQCTSVIRLVCRQIILLFRTESVGRDIGVIFCNRYRKRCVSRRVR